MNVAKILWARWTSFAHKIGVFQSKVILTVFYLLLAPFGFFFSLIKDELKIKKIHSSTWVSKKDQSESLADLQKQY